MSKIQTVNNMDLEKTTHCELIVLKALNGPRNLHALQSEGQVERNEV